MARAVAIPRRVPLEARPPEEDVVEEAQRPSLLERVADHVPLFLAYVDRSLRVRYLNQQYGRWYERPIEEIRGRHVRDFVDAERWSTIEPRYRRVFEGEAEVHLDRFIASDGSERWGRVVMSPDRDEEGAVRGVIVSISDVTDLKRTEVELKRAHVELEERMLDSQRLESLGLLASGMAHDINSLLQVIHGQLELVALGAGSEALAAAQQALRGASELGSQLLACSGRGSGERQPVEVNELVGEVTKLVARSLEPDRRLEVATAESPAWVLADTTQLRQVLLNLLLNAKDAIGSRGGIEVRVGFENDTVVLEVADDGPGIGAEIRDRVFEPFFSTREGGRGLGLAAVRGIVSSHDGTLELDRSPSGGARFRVRLPRHERDAGSWPGAGPVLVVDDDSAFLKTSVAILEHSGVPVLEAEGGADAVRIVGERSDLALVMLDLRMPEMDGSETFDAIRDLDPDLPVLFASGYPRLAGPLLRQARTDLLVKPWSAPELVAKVRGLARARP